MTDKQKRDYLTGRIIRYADNVGRFDEALEFIRTHKKIEELGEYQEELTYLAYGKCLATDSNFLVEEETA